MFDKKRFDIAYEEGSIAMGTRMVLVDKETGVNYCLFKTAMQAA